MLVIVQDKVLRGLLNIVQTRSNLIHLVHEVER